MSKPQYFECIYLITILERFMDTCRPRSQNEGRRRRPLPVLFCRTFQAIAALIHGKFVDDIVRNVVAAERLVFVGSQVKDGR